MALEDFWSAAALAYFMERYGGFREAAVAAWNRPGGRKQLERQGASLEIADDGEPILRVPYRDREPVVARIVEALVGPPPATLQDGGPESGAERWELVNGPLGEGLEPDPYSEPEPLEEGLFENVRQCLDDDESLRSIQRKTGLSIQQVSKIRDYLDHPNRLVPGSSGYAMYRQPSRPGTISLRKLRPMRS